jgi:hypothetical protein
MPRGAPKAVSLSPALFIKVGEALYGSQWQTELARALGGDDPRNVRRMAQGTRPIRMGVAQKLADLCAANKTALRTAHLDLVAEIAALDGDDIEL